MGLMRLSRDDDYRETASKGWGRMAAIDIGWTPTALRAVYLALTVSLERVPEAALRDTAIVETWRDVQRWVQAVQRLLDTSDDAIRLDEIPPFPLKSSELQALLASLDRIAQARAAASPNRIGTSPERILKSFRRIKSSAFGLGVVLAASTTITLLDLTVFHGADSRLYFGLSLGTSCIGLAIWVIHFCHLGAHKAHLEKAHPLNVMLGKSQRGFD